MAKRKLSPFTVDDASDAFVPTVKEYISSEPQPEVQASGKKKTSAKKSAPPKAKAPSRKKKTPPQTIKTSEPPVADKTEEKAVAVPVSQPIESPTAPEVAIPPVKSVSESRPEMPASVSAQPAPKSPPPQPIQNMDENVLSANRFTGDMEEEGFQDMSQFVGFMLDQEAFGIDILLVREIIRVLDITPVPQTEEYVEGVINLRGKVIPIINLRSRLDLEEWEEDKDARIVIIEHEGRMIGFTVDRVSEVIRIPKDAIEPPPAIVAGVESEYLDGVAKTEDQLIVLLNITKLLAKQLQKTNS